MQENGLDRRDLRMLFSGLGKLVEQQFGKPDGRSKGRGRISLLYGEPSVGFQHLDQSGDAQLVDVGGSDHCLWLLLYHRRPPAARVAGLNSAQHRVRFDRRFKEAGQTARRDVLRDRVQAQIGQLATQAVGRQRIQGQAKSTPSSTTRRPSAASDHTKNPAAPRTRCLRVSLSVSLPPKWADNASTMSRNLRAADDLPSMSSCRKSWLPFEILE